MKKIISFQFNFDLSSDAEVIAKSLTPELKQKILHTNVEVSVSDKTLLLEIVSNDTSSLRAACNSYLRWINTAISVHNLV